MANLIKCPNCGENNLADRETCQYCQSPLKSLIDKGLNGPLMPGQAPTKKTTGDLEPVLPQWLRDARETARQTSMEDAPRQAQTPPSTFSSDLLAGLQSQSQDEEEEVPDWLANITGQSPTPRKSQPESSEARWVELGDKKDFAQSEPEPDLPPWLSGVASSSTQASEKDELADWLRSADAARIQESSQPPSFNEPPAAETQDWLRSMVPDDGTAFSDTSSGAADEPFISSDTPDWLRGLEASATASGSGSTPAFSDASAWLKDMESESATPQPATPPVSDTPDWLKAMDAQNAPFQPSAQPEPSDTPDWLKAMDAQSTPFQSSAQPEPSDTPDWLKAMDAQSTPFQPSAQPEPSDTPDWLNAMGTESGSQPASSDTPDWLKVMGTESDSQPVSSDTPDWLKAMDVQPAGSAVFAESIPSASDALTSSTGDEPDWLKGLDSGAPATDQDWLKSFESVEEKQPGEREKPVQPQPSAVGDSDLDVPDWLKAAAPQSSIFEDTPAAQETISKPQAAPESLPKEPAGPVPSPAGGVGHPAADTDSLFTEMPDWLSLTDDTIAPETPPAPITNVDAIAPGELPSWVQAMRPVDAGIPQSMASLTGDKALETRGALAGLQGVLPAVPGFAPARKPKAHSIKLQASEEQQQHAGLLEQIISAETEPVPLDSFLELGPSRVLRLLLAFLFLIALTVFLVIPVFDLPMAWPAADQSALRAVNAIPNDAPVLVMFDYEPGRLGEMETMAVPMFEQLCKRNIRLTFVSTTETGPLLAERLLAGDPRSENPCQGVQYLNLGYLPGGQMGIRAFAENPSATIKYVFDQANPVNLSPILAWTHPTLAGVNSLFHFSALILVTDNADSARAWIEQTGSARGNPPNPPVPLVVISSAQSAPMLQPYYASGQINGLVSGLYGGALFQQNNGGNPGTVRAYWDAYSAGILLAVVLILGGGLLNLVLGLRDRLAAREEK